MRLLIKNPISHFFSRYFERWLARAIPAAPTIFLNRKNIFIFPSKIGVFFIIVALVIWLLGTNYQNNLVLFIAYFMFALFVIAIHQTFAILNKLSISFKYAAPVFVGENAEFDIQIKNNNSRIRESIYCYFKPTKAKVFDNTTYTKSKLAYLDCESTELICVPFLSTKRGWLNPGRLCVETVYPFGLLRCWTWVDIKASCLVYPKPIHAPISSSGVSDEGDENMHSHKSGDEYSGLKTYHAGDEIKRIAWKASSKGKGMYVKEYSQKTSSDLWLNIEDMQTQGLENQLSGLCYWVLHHQSKGDSFGLIINDIRVAPGDSQPHYREVMNVLATYGHKSAAHV